MWKVGEIAQLIYELYFSAHVAFGTRVPTEGSARQTGRALRLLQLLYNYTLSEAVIKVTFRLSLTFATDVESPATP